MFDLRLKGMTPIELGIDPADVAQRDALGAHPHGPWGMLNRRRSRVWRNFRFQDQAKLLVTPDRETLNRRVKGPRFDNCKVAVV